MKSSTACPSGVEAARAGAGGATGAVAVSAVGIPLKALSGLQNGPKHVPAALPHLQAKGRRVLRPLCV